MGDHWMDSYLFMMTAVAATQRPSHSHLLVKDPLRLGWRCRAQECRFFKPAHEFDGIRELS
ncbi:hypothetical protein [Streptomyces sp. NPDC060188]|uniref:hypothetical protein n=1 Tax=Streptomyces sp. NPDC060188 TaxID=3347068 RepID=UPI0036540685